MEVDVLIVGNFRFPGGTSTAIISEVRALADAGYSVGLLSLANGLLSDTRSIHKEIFELTAVGQAAFVPQGERVSARLCCLHHPSVFEELPAVSPQIRCPKFVMIAHHPPADAIGVPQYDVGKVMRVTTELFGPVVWAPVGPKVRDAFSDVSDNPPLTPEDWHNIIDAENFSGARFRLPGSVPVVGRHSRPQAVKWPDDRETFIGAYPDHPDIFVRLMGYGSELDDIVEDRPKNWEILPFDAMPVPDFLGTIDYFSYFHGEDWIEAFGRSILEAMAAGLVCFLPHDFEPLFRDGAVYCEPAEVLRKIQFFEQNPDEYDAQATRAHSVVRQCFGPRVAVDRVRALIGQPCGSQPARAARQANILFVTSNGIGMGHITRCMAIARRLGPDCKPTIVTMSKAFQVARDQGIEVEYLPYFRSVGLDHDEWNVKLAKEFMLILSYHRPDVLVFDGNAPYSGLMDAMHAFPEMWAVWQRRPLWRPEVGKSYLEISGQFDVVLEPGELADPVDRGLTKSLQSQVHQVQSVRFLDVGEALDRRAARSLLNLDPDRPAVLLQLGSGNNFSIRAIVDLICKTTDPRTEKRQVQLFFARWRISLNAIDLPDHVQELDVFPISRFLNAFDCAVAFAGYNTFHENIAAALPTLFTSNDNPEHDEQWLRADYAELRGLALSARASDTYQFRRQLRTILEPAVQDQLRAACERLDPTNGAEQAARYLAGLAHTRKSSHLQFRPAMTLVR